MTTPTIETLTAAVLADATARADATIEDLASAGHTTHLNAGVATASCSRRVVADVLRRAMGGGVIVGERAATLRALQSTHAAALESAHRAAFTARAMDAATARGWTVPTAAEFAAQDQI